MYKLILNKLQKEKLQKIQDESKKYTELKQKEEDSEKALKKFGKIQEASVRLHTDLVGLIVKSKDPYLMKAPSEAAMHILDDLRRGKTIQETIKIIKEKVLL